MIAYNSGRISPSMYPKIKELMEVNSIHNGAYLVQIWNENQVGERLCTTCPGSISEVRAAFAQIIKEAENDSKGQ